jgi:hypothetical protein
MDTDSTVRREIFRTKKRSTGITSALLLFFAVVFAPLWVFSQENQTTVGTSRPQPVIIHAVMCEGIGDQTPKNPAVTFSMTIGTVFCLTSFDPVPEKTVVYHNWFRRDRFSTRIKLGLNPPRWSAYSSVSLREEDKGPWRVEVRDENDNLIRLVRFSITD